MPTILQNIPHIISIPPPCRRRQGNNTNRTIKRHPGGVAPRRAAALAAALRIKSCPAGVSIRCQIGVKTASKRAKHKKCGNNNFSVSKRIGSVENHCVHCILSPSGSRSGSPLDPNADPNQKQLKSYEKGSNPCEFEPFWWRLQNSKPFR